MRRAFSMAVMAVLAAAFVGLAVANRHVVTVYVSPFHHSDEIVSLPLYLLMAATFAAGILVGGIATRLSQRADRLARGGRRNTKRALAALPLDAPSRRAR